MQILMQINYPLILSYFIVVDTVLFFLTLFLSYIYIIPSIEKRYQQTLKIGILASINVPMGVSVCDDIFFAYLKRNKKIEKIDLLY